MKLNRTVPFILLLVFIVIGFSNNASGFLGIGDSVSWKEEVLLHDGSKIVVERWQKRGGPHSLGERPAILKYSISFKHPDTKKTITWKDGPTEDIERASLEVVALHIKDNTPYIINTIYLGCRASNKWGRPNPPYVIFKYEGNDWKRIQLSELPQEFKNVNLVINTTGYDEEKAAGQGLITTEKVKELNKGLTQEIYKTIVRMPFNNEGRCPELIYCGKGQWLGVDFFKTQSSYKECVKFCNFYGMSAESCPCERLFKDKKGE